MNKEIMEQFLDIGAVPLQLAHLFLQQELEDELDIDMKHESYQNKGMIEESDDEDKRIKETDYTDNGKKFEQRIISNIKAYYCKRAVSNGSTQKPYSFRNGTLRNGSL